MRLEKCKNFYFLASIIFYQFTYPHQTFISSQQEHPIRAHEQPGGAESGRVPCIRAELIPDASPRSHAQWYPGPSAGAAASLHSVRGPQ